MPAFVPSAATLLQAAADDLERDVLPALAGFPRFRTRVIVNVLRLLTRELALGDAADAAEQARLQALLDSGSDDLPALRAELARRIEAGSFDLADEALLQHLRESLRDALAIDNPAWTRRRA
ncbi:DUF6285 domain-containing protein [Variovorax sp. JS1663]|uniref:DUF6285 domain-containing protein n=1 Tax=Variovorax sp. JS1663 TaxID=1851577 RepID=UPI000B348814|nr:DUF6285 domain-containing protein [Variovorax sp. JS1663]OUL99615.1 hypothetical protein A8M77_25645 [Variovorax sp. JS1663]